MKKTTRGSLGEPRSHKDKDAAAYKMRNVWTETKPDSFFYISHSVSFSRLSSGSSGFQVAALLLCPSRRLSFLDVSTKRIHFLVFWMPPTWTRLVFFYGVRKGDSCWRLNAEYLAIPAGNWSALTCYLFVQFRQVDPDIIVEKESCVPRDVLLRPPAPFLRSQFGSTGTQDDSGKRLILCYLSMPRPETRYQTFPVQHFFITSIHFVVDCVDVQVGYLDVVGFEIAIHISFKPEWCALSYGSGTGSVFISACIWIAGSVVGSRSTAASKWTWISSAR